MMAQLIKIALSSQIKKLPVRNLCSYSKSVSAITQTGTDFLFNNLKNATNTKSILDMVSKHSNIMNNKHIMQALRTLFVLQKKGGSELSTKDILRNPQFLKLCRKLKSQAASIEMNETIEALKVVSYVGVPPDSTIFQVLLQLLRHNVNLLNLQQIIFLDFLLASQPKSTNLAEALQLALPIVFEVQLPVKMDYDNPAHLAEYLFFASRNQMSNETIKKIVNALMNESNEFDFKTAKSIVWSICDMEYSEMFENLMRKAINSLVVHFDEMNFTEIESTLSKLISRFRRNSTYFYNETFFDSCANYVIDNDMGFKASLYILRKFARVYYYNNFLLDYMAMKVHENHDLIIRADPVDIYSIVISVSLTDYRPIHWETLKNLIAQVENLAHYDRKEIIWIKFTQALCILEIFKLDILSKCLNETYLHHLFKKKFMSDFENYATIWQSIALFKPELNCLKTPRFAPEVVYKHFRPPLDFPFKGALHKALGGEKYVKTDVHSKLGHQIDHILVFRKGGYPVALNTNVEFIEDVEVQADNQLVAILGLRHYAYTLNNRQLLYSTMIGIKSLESKGYIVVPICLEIWENLPDFEKIPYIMQAIKEKTYNDLNISENVM